MGFGVNVAMCSIVENSIYNGHISSGDMCFDGPVLETKAISCFSYLLFYQVIFFYFSFLFSSFLLFSSLAFPFSFHSFFSYLLSRHVLFSSNNIKKSPTYGMRFLDVFRGYYRVLIEDARNCMGSFLPITIYVP